MRASRFLTGVDGDWNPCHVTMTLADDELTFNRLIGLKIGYKIAIPKSYDYTIVFEIKLLLKKCFTRKMNNKSASISSLGTCMVT